MSDYWFGPKRIGVGIRPTNWKGWVSLLIFAAVVAAVGVWFLPRHNVIGFVIGTVAAIVVLLVIALAKCEPRQKGG